jgi:hypothetical protein
MNVEVFPATYITLYNYNGLSAELINSYIRHVGVYQMDFMLTPEAEIPPGFLVHNNHLYILRDGLIEHALVICNACHQHVNIEQ